MLVFPLNDETEPVSDNSMNEYESDSANALASSDVGYQREYGKHTPDVV